MRDLFLFPQKGPIGLLSTQASKLKTNNVLQQLFFSFSLHFQLVQLCCIYIIQALHQLLQPFLFLSFLISLLTHHLKYFNNELALQHKVLLQSITITNNFRKANSSTSFPSLNVLSFCYCKIPPVLKTSIECVIQVPLTSDFQLELAGIRYKQETRRWKERAFRVFILTIPVPSLSTSPFLEQGATK